MFTYELTFDKRRICKWKPIPYQVLSFTFFKNTEWRTISQFSRKQYDSVNAMPFFGSQSNMYFVFCWILLFRINNLLVSPRCPLILHFSILFYRNMWKAQVYQELYKRYEKSNKNNICYNEIRNIDKSQAFCHGIFISLHCNLLFSFTSNTKYT